jgi:hypothetical protein
MGNVDSTISHMARFTSSHMELRSLGASNGVGNKSTVSMVSVTGEHRSRDCGRAGCG